MPHLRRDACLAAVLALGACSSSEPRVPTTIVLDATSLSFTAVGQTQQLSPSVSDQQGNPIDGAAVSWSSSNTSVATVSSTGLVTAAGGGTAEITATAGAASAAAQVAVTQAPAQLTKVSGDGQTGTAGETLPEPLVVEVKDALGNLAAGATVVFAISEGGGSVSSSTVTTSSDGRASTTFTPGTVAGAPQVVSVSIPATAIVVSFSATTTAGAPASISMVAGNNGHATAGNPVPVRPSVLVTDAHDNPVAGVAVEFEVLAGGGSITGASSVTNADGRASVGSWTLGAANPNLLRATAAAADINCNPATFTASTANIPFNIEVRFLGCMNPAQLLAFTQAEQKWETLVAGDLSNVLMNEVAGTCDEGTPAINETVDDLIIFATIEPIDGPEGILGQAGPCFIRDSDFLPVVGVMFFDSEDLDFIESEGLLQGLILHEMGHVLGFGTLWPFQALLTGSAASGGLDPHFTGSQALAAFDAAGGTGYTGAKVPVENEGGPGTIDSHWRESVFDNELMTGFINLGTNLLSAISVASLGDQGYAVDLSDADPYTLTAALKVAGQRRGLDLRNDIRRVPLRLVDAKGRLTRMFRR